MYDEFSPDASSAVRIVSITRNLPNPDSESEGIFVLHRLRAMAEQAEVFAVQPIPYLPGVKPLPAWAAEPSRRLASLPVMHAPMLYTPGMLKSANGFLLERSITGIIERLQREAPIDAIDAHYGYPEGVACLRIAQRLRVPLFITLRGFENEFVKWRWIGTSMIDAMRNATGCIAVSESLRALAVAHGVSPARTCVIHNAIDSTVFRRGDHVAARAALGIDQDRPVIVSVGHLISRKRHHVLIEAFSILRDRRPDAMLAIAGTGLFERRYPAELASLTRRHDLDQHVRFLGDLTAPDIAMWLQAADVFALATAREGCCNAILEALATGLPVVTTPVGDNAYFVRDEANGSIVPVDDAAALGEALESVLDATWDKAAIASRLLQQAGSWSAVGTRVLEFMRSRLEDRSIVATRS